MASTREPSPTETTGTASPVPLTPNSKIKALLAQFDADSDDEAVAGSARRRLNATLVKDPVTSTKDASADSPPTDPEDEEIVRPKGRMAARMMAAKESSAANGNSSDERPRERTRKLQSANKKSSTTASTRASNESNDSNPPISRKRKLGTPRRATPGLSPQKGPASPSLFVSPMQRRSATPADNASDSDDLPQAKDFASNARFQALVEKKRQERKAREAEALKEKTAREEERKRQRALMAEDGIRDDDDDDEEIERRLTQRAPGRKASKRALEEMHRETQRLSRNQQLAHNATTKKKFTRSGLFAIFNYNADNEKTGEAEHEPSSSPPAPHSEMESKETPPSSPPSPEDAVDKPSIVMDNVDAEVDDSLPTLEDLPQMPSSPPGKIDKGKGKAIKLAQSQAKVVKKPLFTQRPIRVRPPPPAAREVSAVDDSDSDLEIVAAKTLAPKKKIDMIFDNVTAKQSREPHSMQIFRMLAHLTSPGNQSVGRNKKPSITASEMQLSLQQLARQQAARERDEKLQALRARGIIVQTTEEREKEMAEVDDLLAKARQEGEDIMKREKAAAKKERKAAGEDDPLGESSDDEDWTEDKTSAEHAVPGSGSDDDGEFENDASGESEEEDELEEEDNEMDADDPEAEIVAPNPFFDEEAGENSDDEMESDVPKNQKLAEPDGEEDDIPVASKRRSRKSNVISDDEDTDDEVVIQQTPKVPQTVSPIQNTKSPMAPNSVLRSATKTFIPGLPVVGVAGLGLTQIFAGTMDESQQDIFTDSPLGPAPTFGQNGGQDNPMAFLRQLPAPSLPPFVATLEEETQEADRVGSTQHTHFPESQPTQALTQGIHLDFDQSQFHGFDSLVDSTQMSPFPEATQDMGFQHMTPIKGRFVDAPPSTVDTLVLEETPVMKKKGKLHRRAPIVNFSDDEDVKVSNIAIDEDDLDISSNAFDVMRKALKKKKIVVDEFDKKKSDAKQMVQEQAEESEDEYAGLGGASDDESGGEEDAFVKEMIDDEAGKDADDRQNAAFFADRERARDEKQVEKLYNDISKGMLRRKRGADYDLSDSDDGGEARQRRKRKEFAKMRKLLLADERIGKIAENPKRQAFLRAIEDRGSEDEMDFLQDFPDQDSATDSQSQGAEVTEVIPNSQPAEMGPPKRKFSTDDENNDARVPPNLRRTKTGRKPSNLSEIRESLSSLIEEPNAIHPPVDSESESEDELVVESEDLSNGPVTKKAVRDPFTLRRTNVPIIDRISLKRQSSSTISSTTRLAFSTSAVVPGFKVPPLLRRATTNSSITSASSGNGNASTTERTAGGVGSEGGVKRGGGKSSGVNFFARESERRAALVKTEKRREQKLAKGAQVRRKVVGGMLGGGKFE